MTRDQRVFRKVIKRRRIRRRHLRSPSAMFLQDSGHARQMKRKARAARAAA